MAALSTVRDSVEIEIGARRLQFCGPSLGGWRRIPGKRGVGAYTIQRRIRDIRTLVFGIRVSVRTLLRRDS